MIIKKCIQYSPEYWEYRRGMPTASAFDRIITPGGKASKQADGYMDELIAEIVCLNPNFFTDRPMTRDMANGTNVEPEARNYYAMENPGKRVQEVGFCTTDDGRFGCSPDGLVDDDGLVELKCPILKTQVQYLREDVIPPEYMPQVHGQLIVTGRAYVDFMSYAPGLPAFTKRVEADAFTKEVRVAMEVFWEKFAALKARFGVK